MPFYMNKVVGVWYTPDYGEKLVIIFSYCLYITRLLILNNKMKKKNKEKKNLLKENN